MFRGLGFRFLGFRGLGEGVYSSGVYISTHSGTAPEAPHSWLVNLVIDGELCRVVS